LAVGQLRLLETDNPLYLPTNTSIRLLITGMDVIHSWAMPAFGIKTDAIPGRLNQTWLTIDKAGTYYGQCSELCGVNHAFMPTHVVAVDPMTFLDDSVYSMMKKVDSSWNDRLFGNFFEGLTPDVSLFGEIEVTAPIDNSVYDLILNETLDPKDNNIQTVNKYLLGDDKRFELINELLKFHCQLSPVELYDLYNQEIYGIVDSSFGWQSLYDFMLFHPTSYEAQNFRLACLKLNYVEKYDTFMAQSYAIELDHYSTSPVRFAWSELESEGLYEEYLKYYPDSLEAKLFFNKIATWEDLYVYFDIMSKPKTQEGILEFEKILGSRSLKRCRKLTEMNLVSFENCLHNGYKFKNEL